MPRKVASFLHDLSAQALVQGAIIALVGYASSVTLVVHGLAAMGASEAQIISGLLLVGLTKGAAAIYLSLCSKIPISIAWTTPGMALLISMPALEGGFAALTGALITTGMLIMLSAFWSPLARLIQAIPKSLANAMLAGILLKLCLAPFSALKAEPWIAALVLITWLGMLRFARLWATPAAVAIALIAIAWQTGPEGLRFALPSAVITPPVFSYTAMIGVAVPLFILTMASQNITGLAVLSTFNYHPSLRSGLGVTGLLSALSAPFGAPTINFAAITAALCASPEAHADPKRRYIAAVFAGLGYMLLALAAVPMVTLILTASPLLIEAAAGLALISAFGGALKGATDSEAERIPALLAFLVAASGLSFWGISGAFWGLLIGWSALIFLAYPRMKPSAINAVSGQENTGSPQEKAKK